ncbi:hypothetical protein [Streptomyces sp. NPDC048442]
MTSGCARRIEAYERELHEISGVPDFLRAMRELAGVELDGR